MNTAYIFRFVFAEIFSMAAILSFLFLVLPCKKNRKKGAIIIAYFMVLVYVAIMIGLGKNLYTDGIPYRSILMVTELFILPAYLIKDKKWYRYIGLASVGNMTASCIGTFLYQPIFYLATGKSVLDPQATDQMLYREPNSFYLLFLYQMVNFIAYFLLGKIWRKVAGKEIRKKRILIFAQVIFVIEFVCINAFFVPRSEEELILANIVSLISMNLGLLFIVRGLIWEKTIFKKEQEFIQMRENVYYDSYQQISQEQERAREVRHDLADHMQTVQLLLENGEEAKARAYIEACRELKQL